MVRGGGRQDKKRRAVQADPGEAALEEAQALQQRAERRRGREAIDQYSRSVVKFEQALQLGVPPSLHPEALFGLAESLQQWAQQVLSVEKKLPDAQQSAAVSADASESATRLLRRSAEALERMGRLSGATWDRSDGPVNFGNVLSELAELVPAREQIVLLQKAVECYEAALVLEKDAVTCGNLADVLIQLAQAHHDVGSHNDSCTNIGRARETYIEATALSSSDDGDDLPGLLCNWATGLLSAAKMESSRDPAMARTLVEEAITRTESSISFKKQDIEVVTLLGEARLALAEMLKPAEATPVLAKALQGFDSALKIDMNNTDTLASAAEAHLLSGRIAIELGAAQEAQAQLKLSIHAFEKCIQKPETLGSFTDRCSLRFNYACALSLCKEHSKAIRMLADLIKVAPDMVADIKSDADLACLRDLPEYNNIMP